MPLSQFFPQLPLTQNQLQALTDLERFLHSPDKAFLLKGYAGTGKTTLLAGICNYLEAEKRQFVLLAPTGRAAMILREKTKFPTSTIHRGIYNMEKLEEKKEGESFKFYYQLKINEESADCIYLVDEASMISDEHTDDEFFTFGSGYLLKDLIRYVFGRDLNRKIIFVGDQAQLPPVNMNFSPALDAECLREGYGLSVSGITLSQVVRQESESGILNSATRIREAIAKDTFNQFSLDFGKGDVMQLLPESFSDQYVEVARQTGTEKVMVITHSNRQALDYNQQIRKLRYGVDMQQVQRKDRLLITKNNYNGPVDLFNGMFVDVLEVGDISYQPLVRFKVRGGETEEVKLAFRDVVVIVPTVEGAEFTLKTTLLDDFLTDPAGRISPEIQQALYVDFKERMKKRGIYPNHSEYKDALKADKYFNALQAKYGYAITCHKSQGGEWPVAMVDFRAYLGFLTRGYFRWAYTAITRGKNRLFCIEAPSYNALSKFIVRDVLTIGKVMKGAFFVPQKEGDPAFFVQHRKDRLTEICAMNEISVQFSLFNNQLDTQFRRGEEFGRVQLWFTRDGFSKNTWHAVSNEIFKNLLENILLESLLPVQIPFTPRFDFQLELHQYLIDLLAEEEVRLTNIVQREWSDEYFLYTGADCAALEFYFDSKHIYSNVSPKSTLGLEDHKLRRIVAKLRGEG